MNHFISRLPLLALCAGLGLRSEAVGQIPNEGFENWTDCLPDNWASPNVCGVLTTLTKVPASNSGSWAARGEVASLFGQAIAPFLQSGDEGQGSPISQRYKSLRGSYRFDPVGGDRFAVNVAFFRGGVVVAQGAFANPAAARNYTPFTLNMNYVSADVPDNATIQITIIGPVTGPDFHVGSVMHVDSLAFTTGSVSLPSLSFQRSGDAVIISWPADVVGYRLQSTPTLAPAEWSDVPNVVNNSHQTKPTATAFFRLVGE